MLQQFAHEIVSKTATLVERVCVDSLPDPHVVIQNSKVNFLTHILSQIARIFVAIVIVVHSI